MDFNKHSDLAGQHAFLSPSKHAWVNYSPEKIDVSFTKALATQKGTELHDFARRCIELRRRQPKTKDSVNQFVNDAIGFGMTPEQPLFYSWNAFGTADAISFRNNVLRIHDLKTGVTPVSMIQLEIYAAYFCLEYKVDPLKISFELRIYQGGIITEHKPEGKDILEIMEKTIEFDKRIERIKSEEMEE